MRSTCFFPVDECLLTNVSTSSLSSDQESSLNTSLCPSCRDTDFRVTAEPSTECFCRGNKGECSMCQCSNVSKLTSVRNVSCGMFRIAGPATSRLIRVEFDNITIPDISISIGDNVVLLNINDTQKTSLSYANQGPYQFIQVFEGTLNLLQSPFEYYVIGSMSNLEIHYSLTSGNIYMAENNFENVTEIEVGYFRTLISSNFSLCNISEQTTISVNSKIVDLSRNTLRTYFVNKNTEVLYIQHNSLDKIIKNSAEAEKLLYYPLSILDISYNRIRRLQREDFKYYVFLVSLNLAGNLIQNIDNDTFADLPKLVSIDLSGNKISGIQREHFRGLSQLQFVYIQQNDIFQVPSDIFHGLVSMKYLQVQSFSICCAKPQSLYSVRCVAPATEISSCEHLIAVPVLNVAIWYMALLALFGNISVMVYILAYFRKKVPASYFILTLNLSCADLLMGVYLFIIAIVNLHYTGYYGLQDYAWRHSWLCTLAGILATVSSEASALIVFLITVDRFLAIKYSISDKRITKTGVIVLCFCVWLISLFLATFPLAYFDNFYSKSGVCISLPLSVIRKTGWRYSMAIFVGINALLFTGILIGQIAIFVEALKVSKDVRSEKIRAREISLAKTLIAIVVTDILCWIPIGIIGKLGLNFLLICKNVSNLSDCIFHDSDTLTNI